MLEKRRYPRFTVEGVHGKMVFASQVEVLNLSLGGVAIRADRRLNIGSEYTLSLEMETRLVAVKGLVVWSVLSGLRRVAEESVAEYSAGLKFTDVLNEKLQGLLDFIEAHKVSEEARLGGIRFQIEAPGKAFLDTSESLSVRLVSLSGMLIETRHRLDVDEVYAMEIQPVGFPPIRFQGRVASFFEVLDDEPGSYEMGIEFVQLGPDDRARLESFVRSLSSAQPVS